MDCVRQRIATSENVEPVTRTACAAWRRTPNSAAAATSRPTDAKALYADPGATLDVIREAVTRLEDLERTARRVFGGAHPTVADMEKSLRISRRVLRNRESLLAKYLLYGASALALIALVQRSRRR